MTLYFNSVFGMIKCLHYRRGRQIDLGKGRTRIHLYGKQLTAVIVGPVDA